MGAQLRAARGLLGWNQKDLAEHAGVGVSTVRRMEKAEGPTGLASHYYQVREACERAHIRFVDGDPINNVIAGVLLLDPDLRGDS